MKPFKTTLIVGTVVLLAACNRAGAPAPAASATAPPAASTADVIQVERELAKMQQDWIDAALKADVATVDRILADDFVATLPDGRLMTKAQDIEELRSGAFVPESTTIDGMNVRVFGETAIVTFGQTEKSQYHGRTVSGRTLWTDVFLKRNGTWQIVAEHGSIAPDSPRPGGRAA